MSYNKCIQCMQRRGRSIHAEKHTKLGVLCMHAAQQHSTAQHSTAQHSTAQHSTQRLQTQVVDHCCLLAAACGCPTCPRSDPSCCNSSYACRTSSHQPLDTSHTLCSAHHHTVRPQLPISANQNFGCAECMPCPLTEDFSCCCVPR